VDFTLDQLKTGDRIAWDHAFEFFYGVIHNTISGSVGKVITKEDIEDIALQGIVRLIQKQVKLESSSQSLKKWVSTTVKNLVKDLVRNRLAQKRGAGMVDSIEDSPSAWEAASESLSPDQIVAKTEDFRIIQEAMSQVNEKYRVIAEDFYYLELTHQEIADKRGLKIGSIGVYLNRAYEACMAILEKSRQL
jgi:RNA polymerase sigma factor (sigma-70 family)